MNTQKPVGSVGSTYAVGAVWLLWATLFPLYRPIHYGLAAAASAAVFFAVKGLRSKGQEEPTEVSPAPIEAEDSELAALKAERDRVLSEMRRLNSNIEDTKISAQIDHLEMVTKAILDYVVSQPQKRPQIRKFMDYYLPTTLKLLNAYDRMDSTGVAGANIDGTMGKIETMMDTVVQAFDRQMDALFADEALDISADITVMENLLAQEGLTGPKL
ncbi:MAG: hypothetical protein HFE97_12275 [Oscillospiraceae bacterium]|nr:hypothetical protein [Oscillospiraceae bacterium]